MVYYRRLLKYILHGFSQEVYVMAATTFEPRSREDVILEVRDANVTYDMERGESKVLNSVDLDVRHGEVLGIVGESGSGKSMLANAILDAVVEPGILTGSIWYYPDDGEPVDVLDLGGEELRRLRWEEIAMVFQGAMSSFNPTMRLRDHFEETLEEHEYDMREGMERTNQLLSDLYLDPERILDSYPHELSGGMKQRALIALSLVLEPDLLVMDEPTAALDLLMQRSILSLLRRLQDRYDLTLVFITHDLPLAARLANRLAVIYAFQIVEVGPTVETVLDAAHPYTRMLLKTTPNLDAPVEQMRPIEGSSPDPVNVPSGCSYHPRCPLAAEHCENEEPELLDVDADHTAACFYWEQADEAIPYELEEAIGGDAE